MSSSSEKLLSYKSVCAKLGFIMSVYFICRIVAVYTLLLISRLADEIGVTAAYISAMVIQIMLMYMVPILVAAILFKSFGYYSGRLRLLYKRPRRMASALGSFPAMYGLGFGVAYLTALAIWGIGLITDKLIGKTEFRDFFSPASVGIAPNLTCAIVMVVVAAIAAPLFEEFFVRGIMYDALKPYGSGVAIVISACMFGLMHGTVQMLFYTTAIGLALGYIRYATDSLFVVTILHMLFNSVGAGMLFLMFMTSYTGGQSKTVNTISSIYTIAAVVLLFVGIIAFITRIPLIRKYKINNSWSDIGGGKKLALFVTSIPVIIMLILAVNELSGNRPIAALIEKTLS